VQKAVAAHEQKITSSSEGQCASLLKEHQQWLGRLDGMITTMTSVRSNSPTLGGGFFGANASLETTFSSGKTEKLVLFTGKDELSDLAKLPQRWDEYRRRTGMNAGERLTTRQLMSVSGLVYGNECTFKGRDLRLANLDSFGTEEADFSGADLIAVSWRDSQFWHANLKAAQLIAADLRGSKFLACDLSGADLSEARLSNATIGRGTSLRDTTLAFADLSGAFFEPSDVTDVQLFNATGLSELRFVVPTAIINLRKSCKDKGLDREARELTASLFKGNLAAAPLHVRLFSNYVQGGLLTSYGVKPWNAIAMLVGLIPIFAIVYAVALFSKGPSGIYVVHFVDGTLERTQRQLRIRSRMLCRRQVRPIRRACKDGSLILRVSLYFSILTAFQIGYRDFNIGSWISRLQRTGYSLKPTGWVRTISGTQALCSVYLLALWAITFFGNPFE
jgi:hypothetical protein